MDPFAQSLFLADVSLFCFTARLSYCCRCCCRQLADFRQKRRRVKKKSSSLRILPAFSRRLDKVKVAAVAVDPADDASRESGSQSVSQFVVRGLGLAGGSLLLRCIFIPSSYPAAEQLDPRIYCEFIFSRNRLQNSLRSCGALGRLLLLLLPPHPSLRR